MRQAPLWFFLAGGLACAADLPVDVLTLQKARVAMARNLTRLPNYTCVQTIERTERRASGRKPRLLDVLRLEVALVEGKEFYAWPGSGKFIETDLRNMIAAGAIGNGSFALHAKSLFQSNVPRFTYAGETIRENRRTQKWDYLVPQIRSGYSLRAADTEAIVGYHGSIWVDAGSLDLVRLEVYADDIPLNLKLMKAYSAVEYERASISGESFLLPSLSELEMVGIDGSVSANRTKFSSCKHYTGESTITFEEPAPETKAPEPTRLVTAPANLTVELALKDPLVFKDTAVGDPVIAVLKKSLRLPDGTMIPKDSLVHGRLAWFREQYMDRRTGYAVGLKFFEIEGASTRVRMSATLEGIQTASPGIRSRSPFALGRLDRPENEELMGSVFFVQSNISRLDRGLRMTWRTRQSSPEDNQ